MAWWVGRSQQESFGFVGLCICWVFLESETCKFHCSVSYLLGNDTCLIRKTWIEWFENICLSSLNFSETSAKRAAIVSGLMLWLCSGTVVRGPAACNWHQDVSRPSALRASEQFSPKMSFSSNKSWQPTSWLQSTVMERNTLGNYHEYSLRKGS